MKPEFKNVVKHYQEKKSEREREIKHFLFCSFIKRKGVVGRIFKKPEYCWWDN